jgi:ribosome recycling factor
VLEEIKKDASDRMAKSVASLRQELTKLRTGRAHTSLLDHISVEYYGSQVPLSQVSNVGVEDSRTLVVTPWEKDMVSVIEKAIMTSDLGLNPMSAGTVIRVPLPALTEERRKDMIRVVRNEAEGGRIAIRNVRRDALNDIKELLREKMIGEDDERRAHDEIQGITDKYVANIDQVLAEKESELMDGRCIVAVDVAEVPLAVNQRKTQCEILGQTHQGVVNRLIAVGVELADHVADHPGGFLVG